MKSPIALSDFINSENDLSAFSSIETRFFDHEGNEIHISFEDGWYTDSAICYNDLLDTDVFDQQVLTEFAKRYQIHAADVGGEIVLKSKDPAKLLQTIMAVYFWIGEQENPVLG